MTARHPDAAVDVLVAFASRHGATRGIAERICVRLHGIDELRAALRPHDYRVFAGVIRREQWPFASRLLYHAFGGRLGDNRDWDAIDAWADGIAKSLAAGSMATEAR